MMRRLNASHNDDHRLMKEEHNLHRDPYRQRLTRASEILACHVCFQKKIYLAQYVLAF